MQRPTGVAAQAERNWMVSDSGWKVRAALSRRRSTGRLEDEECWAQGRQLSHVRGRCAEARGAAARPDHARRRGNLLIAGDAGAGYSDHARRAQPRLPRVRHTYLGEVEWDTVDPLDLVEADRRADADWAYERPVLDPAATEVVKQKWQARQIMRVSRAPEVFGARESQKALWNFVNRRATDDAAALPADAMPAVAAAAAGPRGAGAAAAARKQALVESRCDLSDLSSSAESASGAATPRHKKSFSVKKEIYSVFKGMWGSSEPAAIEVLVSRMRKKGRNKTGPLSGKVTI